MRELTTEELKQIHGGCCECGRPEEPERVKNNNGFGNGPESGPAPGNSGKTGIDKATNDDR